MAENIESLKNKIEELQKEVTKLKSSVKKKKYGLVWMDVPEAFEDDVENKLPILREIPEKAIITEDGKPTHILIEGDNYHALTCLNYTHKEKIDVIYIDPPYNTGEDDFRYKDKRIIDKFPDGTAVPANHPFRHSYWLSFMKKRLDLCKNLLKPEGIIFISINDNEIAQLKLLLDNYVFGEEYFLGTITWINRTKPVNSGKARFQIQQNLEYILCYSRTKIANFSGFKLKSKGQRKYDDTGKHGKCRLIDIEDSDYGRKKRASMKFPILGVIPPEGKRWKIGAKERDKLLEEGRIEKVNGKIKVAIYPWNEDLTIERPFWSHLDIGLTGTAETGKKQLSDILGKAHNFDTVKPTGLIKELLIHFPSDITVLDFFAGSGTTGHTVIMLNQEDNSNRQFILVTDNENSIMDDICYPRISKVINGFKYQGKQKTILLEEILTWSKLKNTTAIIDKVNSIREENKSKEFETIKKEVKSGVLRVIGEKTIKVRMPALGNSMKYYRTDFVGKHSVQGATDDDKISLAHQAGDLLAIAENTLYKVNENDFWQVYENDESYTCVYFREELDKFEEFVSMVEKLQWPATVYVFSWGDEEFIEEFEHIEEVKVKTIPLPILEIYKNIYNLG